MTTLIAQVDIPQWQILSGFFLVGLIFVVGLIVLGVFARYFRLYIQSFMSRAGIGIWDLVGMTFRKVRPEVIVQAKIMAVQAGLVEEQGISTRALEAHYLAGGNVLIVVRALIAASKAKIIQLSFREATAIDLAGRNVLEAVQTSVYPKVIDCPPRSSGTEFLEAAASDGIQLKVKARVTVRTNLQQLIGGATEETIIARVGEGIVAAIGATDHNLVLENPDVISKRVLARGLDASTAFEIVSIDIADIDVGENVAARLLADTAESDTAVAQALAEGRRARAVAKEQQNIAMIEEARGKLVESEASVPQAIADAFSAGRIGIMEYYRLRNVQADTDMRNAIAGQGTAAPMVGKSA
jgi:uncharacterized protein YqfA (UPF0365 family)